MKKQYEDHILGTVSLVQEINMTNYNLARMNMFLHNINYNSFNIKRGDTLLNPQHLEEKPFDAIVSTTLRILSNGWETEIRPLSMMTALRHPGN